MDDLPKKRLKYMEYKGFNPPLSSSKVAYMVVGNRVIFSATEKVVGAKTSTINAVEEIVRKICEAEGLDWRNCEFYDLQTWIGYPHHGFGYYCLDLLHFGEDYLHVTQWERVSSSLDQDINLPRQNEVQQIVALLKSGEEE